MSIGIACPHCNKALKVPNESQGRRIKCPYCAKQSKVPSLASVSEVPEAEIAPMVVPKEPGPGFGITAMVCGIVGMVLACIPFVGFPLGFIATVFGYLGISRPRGKGMAIAGLALGICSVVFSVVIFFVLLFSNSFSAPSNTNHGEEASRQNLSMPLTLDSRSGRAKLENVMHPFCCYRSDVLRENDLTAQDSRGICERA